MENQKSEMLDINMTGSTDSTQRSRSDPQSLQQVPVFHASQCGSSSSQAGPVPVVPPRHIYAPQPAGPPVGGQFYAAQLGNGYPGPGGYVWHASHNAVPVPSHSSAPSVAPASLDRSTIKRLHLAVFHEKKPRCLLGTFVWALFVCTDGELGQNPKVTLYTIVPDVNPGSWERHHWRQRLLDTQKARLLLCMQFPTSDDAAPYLDSTISRLTPTADDPSLAHGWSPVRWACRFVQWAANQRSMMSRGMPQGQHVAERLSQEAWQAALAVFHGVVDPNVLHNGALFTPYPQDEKLRIAVRDSIQIKGVIIPPF